MRIPQHLSTQFLAYLVSGGLSLVIAVAFYALLVRLGMWYVLASVLTDGVGLLLIFLANKYLVFGKKDRVIHHAVRYAFIQLANTVVQAVLVYLLVEYVGTDKVLARILSIGFCVPANFFLYKYIVYV